MFVVLAEFVVLVTKQCVDEYTWLCFSAVLFSRYGDLYQRTPTALDLGLQLLVGPQHIAWRYLRFGHIDLRYLRCRHIDAR